LSNLTKALVLVVAIVAIGFGLVVWKNKVGGSGHVSYNSITKAEIEMLIGDVAKTNPMMLKRLAEDPEMKKQQLDSLKQLLAFASQAQREGLASDASSQQELRSIRAEVIAVNYDREMNKDKGPMPAFGFITEEMITNFWETAPSAPETGFFAKAKHTLGLGGDVDLRDREQQFNDFLQAKIELMKKGNPEMADREISEDERKQARDIFAKVNIYQDEFLQKAAAGELDPTFIDKTNLQVKLQQVQFLGRLYSEKAAEKIKVTDEEIQKYIDENPELNPEAKRVKAQGILDRAKGGEDFAALANEYSEDPGNADPASGEKQGGIYKDVPKGRMVAPFEAAALALEPGQVAPELVATDFGFHIVKLERKLGPSTAKKDDKTAAPAEAGETYDVRHILISTGAKDPDNPMGREMPVKDFVRGKLEEEREKKLIENLVAQNNVSVPDDFDVPTVTDEQIEEMRRKQQPMPMPMPEGGVDDGHGHGAPAPKTAPKAPAKK
jgi:parvulin-like peptidyl-prolyl isomerase